MLNNKVVILLVSFIIGIFHQRVNALSISIGTYESEGSFSIYENVFIMLIDPLGRETGYNPFLKQWKDDIPGSGSGSDSISDFETGSPGPADFSIYVMEDKILRGEYIIKVFGLKDSRYLLEGPFGKYMSYISSNSTSIITFNLDPTPGAPAPVITKIVTFDTLRQDLLVAQKLNQIGDEKFVNSLIRNIDLAEKLAKLCEKRKFKDKPCQPVIAVLKLFIKRLEIANKLCDSYKGCKSRCGKPADCDEEVEWAEFRKAHGRDKDFKDFFEEWDKDEWHKHKKSCKRFVSDEALKIITEDTQWLIKSLGGEVKGKGKK